MKNIANPKIIINDQVTILSGFWKCELQGAGCFAKDVLNLVETILLFRHQTNVHRQKEETKVKSGKARN